MSRQSYSSDLTDAQWERVEPRVPKPLAGDRTAQCTHDALRDDTCQAAGRAASSSAAILDAQSVKAVEQLATCRGYDGGKRVKGRKRHRAVDTLGLLAIVRATTNRDGMRGEPKRRIGERTFGWLHRSRSRRVPQ